MATSSQISSRDDIKKLLDKILAPMVKKDMISPQDARNISDMLTDAIYNAGGIDPKDNNFIPKLKQCVLTCMFSMKNNELNKEPIKETFTLLFKKELSPKEEAKLNLGLAYILAMEKNPQFKPNMNLAFKDYKDLTKEEKDELLKDIDELAKTLDDPKLLDKKELDDLVKTVKDEIKNPGATEKKLDELNPKHDKKLEENINIMSGKVASNFPISNYGGITAQGPAYSLSPLNLLAATIISSLQPAAVRILAEDRNLEMGESVVDNQEALGETYHADLDMEWKYSNISMQEAGEALEQSASSILEAIAPKAETPKQEANQEEVPSEPTYNSPFKIRLPSETPENKPK